MFFGAPCVCAVQVNGQSLVNADHHHAVAVLKSAGNDITMVITKATSTTSRQVHLCCYDGLLWSPCGIGQTITFSSCEFLLLSVFFFFLA